MDEKMMAKFNEILKENGRQALSIADLEKVVGGDFYFASNVKIKDENDLNWLMSVFLNFENDCGRDWVADTLRAWQSGSELADEPSLADAYLNGGLDGLKVSFRKYL